MVCDSVDVRVGAASALTEVSQADRAVTVEVSSEPISEPANFLRPAMLDCSSSRGAMAQRPLASAPPLVVSGPSPGAVTLRFCDVIFR